jgi:uncharacterized protein
MKKLITTLAFTCSFFFAIAQQTILWKVTKPGNAHVSYLLGTYHLLDQSFVDSLPVIDRLLQKSELVITEVNLDRDKIAALYNTRTGSVKLDDVLSKEEIEEIRNIIAFSKIDIYKLTPGEIYAKLSAYYDAWSTGLLNGQPRMDEYIQQLGNKYGIKQLYLESNLLQMELIQKATSPFDWKFFRKNIHPLLDKYHSPVKTTSPSLGKFRQFQLAYAFDSACINEPLVKQRNDEWMKRLPGLFETTNCFLAAGSRHYYNSCGIIMQLRALGFLVEPVEMK